MNEKKFRVQIQELNEYVLTYIAPSKIAGVGVFAMRDIKKGAKLYTDTAMRIYNLPIAYFEYLRPEIAKLLLERWPQIVNGSNFIYPDTRIQAFMNHSDDPNYNAVDDVALRDIAKGEEITEDYKKIQGYAQVFPWLA